MLRGALKDRQVVTTEWQQIRKDIDGVVIREVFW